MPVCKAGLNSFAFLFVQLVAGSGGRDFLCDGRTRKPLDLQLSVAQEPRLNPGLQCKDSRDTT